MHSSSRAAIVAAWLTLGSSSGIAQGMVCSTEFAAGIGYDKANKRWHSTTFRASEKFVLARSQNPNAKWEVKQLGSNSPVAWCRQDFSAEELLSCSGISQEFHFNRRALRFVHAYTAGYWNEESMKQLLPNRQEGNDTPSVSVGLCTTL